MFGWLAKNFFGTSNDRIIKRLHPQVAAINALEPSLQKFSDDELRAQTAKFKERLEKGESLDDLLPEAFATVREAAKRTLGQRHFDVQLMGGMILHQGKIAEMKTGEGKTLVSTLPAYLNALSGKGVHLVTVNDYLAKRDAEWMSPIYRMLGMEVGVIVHGLDDPERRKAYQADITYGTNNELGFDYLRDNMKFHLEQMAQREFNYAIVDEVDSILVDEARTPLIISGQAEDSSELYRSVDKIIPTLEKGKHFEHDEKTRTVSLSEEGVERAEGLLRDLNLLQRGSLYDIDNVTLLHHVQQGLRAHTLFQRDSEYIVKDGKVVIIDEFTGRMMEGRRYSEGLHQALEAKENVTIQPENQTLASITFQNYFRLYKKLAGMTGTAMTEAPEFGAIYHLDVVEIPTNVPCVREDFDDEVYRTAKEKDAALVTLIKEALRRGQPVLVGTVSIEKSEHLSNLLKKEKVPHQVLNARFHEQEAHIIAQAGRKGAVTIATNMAGRGTDIQLGGNPDFRVKDEIGPNVTDPHERARPEAEIRAEVAAEKKQVLAAGGLYIIGTERHESRRIDNQLRGRSGRQGDPGKSKFFLSLQDDLMRIFGSDRMATMLRRLGLQEGEAITHPWVNKALEKAQQKVEQRNFEIRKNLLRFDDVMNDQRKVVYEQRKDLMRTMDVSEEVKEMLHETLQSLVSRTIPENAYQESWDIDTLEKEMARIFGVMPPVREWSNEEGVDDQEMLKRLTELFDDLMGRKEKEYTPEIWRMVEKNILLQSLDHYWKEHLLRLDHLRQGIGLRAYGQRDPLNEYKREAFDMFETMLGGLREHVTMLLARVQVNIAPAPPPVFERQPAPQAIPAEGGGHELKPALDDPGPDLAPNDPATWGKVPRNAPCPCGSGKKYKHCHGKMDEN
ncbi:MAG: preprotein translocase subunit SecA [Alphaproteobacteria bacterium]|nr:preprotein translocase subunit SecA [Alphaproteobacteria bacterium]